MLSISLYGFLTSLSKLSFNLLQFSENKIRETKNSSYPKHFFKRNNFVKKVWANKNKLSSLRKNIFFDSVHLNLSKIRSWSTEVDFFVVLNILLSLDILNKNRLKNIFQRNPYIDNTFWHEIVKMINSNIVNFSDNYIYSCKNKLLSSPLSIFLLELYLSEIDIYLLSYSSRCNIRRILKDDFIFLDKPTPNYKKKSFLPIRLESNLLKYKSLKSFSITKSNSFKYYFERNIDSFVSFDKRILYTRYLNHIIIGFVSSKLFVDIMSRKLKSFIRSSLHFDIKTKGTFYSAEKNIIFCGFNIRLIDIDNKISLISSIKTKKKFSARISSRILSNQRKIVKNFSFRFQDELFFHMKNLLGRKSLQSLSLKDYKFWTYIFQLEAIRSAQFNKLILTSEKTSLISEELFTNIKYSRLKSYEDYSFDLYISKLQILLRETISEFSFNIPSSVISNDQYINLLFSEFRKKLFIFYENFFIKDLDAYSKKLSIKDLDFVSNLYNSSFSSTDIDFFRKGLLSNNTSKRRKMLEIFIPINFCLKKLKLLGLIHIKKKRPMGSQRYLKLEDIHIIRYFGYLSFVFINWFRCCYNFSKLKLLISFIRQSCFLTLCRKHNKNKSWAYRVYTPDLILIKQYNVKNSYFPSRRYILKLKRRFIFSKLDNFFDEEFFLT